MGQVGDGFKHVGVVVEIADLNCLAIVKNNQSRRHEQRVFREQTRLPREGWGYFDCSSCKLDVRVTLDKYLYGGMTVMELERKLIEPVLNLLFFCWHGHHVNWEMKQDGFDGQIY